MKYRVKPTIVEAMQLTELNFEAVESFIGDAAKGRHYNNERDFLKHENPVGIFLKTGEGTALAIIGDYVVKGEAGDMHLRKAEVFAETHEPVME